VRRFVALRLKLAPNNRKTAMTISHTFYIYATLEIGKQTRELEIEVWEEEFAKREFSLCVAGINLVRHEDESIDGQDRKVPGWLFGCVADDFRTFGPIYELAVDKLNSTAASRRRAVEYGKGKSFTLAH
jgi:hypothetical protein